MSCNCGSNCGCGTGCRCGKRSLDDTSFDGPVEITVTVAGNACDCESKCQCGGSCECEFDAQTRGHNGCKCGSGCSCNPCRC